MPQYITAVSWNERDRRVAQVWILGGHKVDMVSDPAEMPDEDYPYILTTGRNIFHFHTGTMTRRSAKLEAESPEGYVELNPEDAADLSVADRGQVKLVSRRGEIEAKAWVTDRVPRGLVFVPFHYAEAAANVLTIAAVDPAAKIPEFKVCAVRVEAA